MQSVMLRYTPPFQVGAWGSSCLCLLVVFAAVGLLVLSWTGSPPEHAA